MKILVALGCLLAAVPLAMALEIGDSYEKVIAERGAPSGRMEAGGVQILRYPDQTIKLKAGRVVALESGSPRGSAVSAAKAAAPKQAVVPAAPLEKWTTDYAAALAEAKAQNRHVFLFFTGSDWCGWCQRLNREILATPEFNRYAADHLILVELDFPRGKPQSTDVKAQNARLARRYRIEGYPTVIVLDSTGKSVGVLGYQEGGPGPFMDALSKM